MGIDVVCTAGVWAMAIWRRTLFFLSRSSIRWKVFFRDKSALLFFSLELMMNGDRAVGKSCRRY